MDEADKRVEGLKAAAKKTKYRYVAKGSCYRCYGTGRIGFMEGNKLFPIACKCVRRITLGETQ